MRRNAGETHALETRSALAFRGDSPKDSVGDGPKASVDSDPSPEEGDASLGKGFHRTARDGDSYEAATTQFFIPARRL
jgi:hypothetical protein